MSAKSLHVTIAGRKYPLTVDPGEEALIRQAEQQIEESIAVFQKNYAVKDKQDLLAMTALQIASRRIASEVPQKETVIEKVVERIEVEVPADISPQLTSLENLVDSYL